MRVLKVVLSNILIEFSALSSLLDLDATRGASLS